ncbi:hypothetical protein QVD17_31279 [Tagetes erecta]|uniref:Uncharacterized protein n=1 Tax=Tagetes erecta TaxID=13708 RepID=A0AAD8K777_TARER|nr:hypothetical protein QVD17_31279 [Tagetes erecta]
MILFALAVGTLSGAPPLTVLKHIMPERPQAPPLTVLKRVMVWKVSTPLYGMLCSSSQPMNIFTVLVFFCAKQLLFLYFSKLLKQLLFPFTFHYFQSLYISFQYQ